MVQPVEGRSMISNKMEEDGISGGRMKPLASLNVNKDLSASQQGRKLKIKLSPRPGIQLPVRYVWLWSFFLAKKD